MGWRRGVLVTGCVAAVLLVARGESEVSAPPTDRMATAAATAVPLRIMPLGASSTVGGGSPATAGYRGPLQELLARDGVAVDLVGSYRDGPASVRDRDHEGHGGATIADLEPSVRGWIRQSAPDVVLLHAGTNDLLHGVGAAVTAQRLDTLLGAIAAESAAHVVVAGVWAPLPQRTAARAEFARLAAGVVARRRALGQSITYVDTSTLLRPSEFADGLHANAGGYQRIAAMWEREITTWLASRTAGHR